MKSILLLLVALLIAGCATNRIDWSARIGNYTRDQAVLELGPPDKETPLSDGTVVAEWLTRRGYAYVSGPYGYYSGYGPYPYVTGYSPDYFLRLTFRPDGKLTGWKQFSR